LSEDEVYTVSMSSSPSISEYYLVSAPEARSKMVRKQVLSLLTKPPEKVDVTNREIEQQLKGLMSTFENSASPSYAVESAKTTLTVTKSGEGKAELSLGLGIIKLFDAKGKVKGEIKQGIEISRKVITNSSYLASSFTNIE
jgi:hypothetical protein